MAQTLDMVSLFAAALALLSPPVVTILGEDVKVECSPGKDGYSEKFYCKDAKGAFHLILASPISAPALDRANDVTAVQTVTQGLFQRVPNFRFDTATPSADGKSVRLTHDGFTKTVTVPAKGRVLRVALECKFPQPSVSLHSLLVSYAFMPDGKAMSQGGKPDTTFLPGLRPKDENVVGDHFFRAPLAMAQKGSLSASLMPDLGSLKADRPMETVLDLDCKNGVVDAALMSYGFCAHRLTGHVAFSSDSSQTRTVPQHVTLAMQILLDANAAPHAGYEEPTRWMWARYGHGYLNKILPQVRPFAGYAEECYPAAFAEAYGPNKLGWFEQTIDGNLCGGIPSGWGFDQGWVSWQGWFNQLRSAWGLRWWGKKLGHEDWVSKADKMLNLALAAPMKQGAVPTTYLSREKTWRGSLIAPRADCYYDLTNMAWKGIWLLKWAELTDCPRRDEVLAQCKAMADLMVAKQNADGSIPSWLDKDLKVVPILDHSAQSALPIWFLGEMKRLEPAKKGAEFLLKSVVDGQYYYDFETFFSCSPKECFQRDGKVDHEAMRDMHSLQAPQNTLCMQWAAEALNSVARQDSSMAARCDTGAMKALSMMALYQNVWPISYRKVAYTYGGFGVQNSDGEYNDARQAQFGVTLCDFGARLGRQDLFERGVAATRATLTLINDPLHASLGVYPNPNYLLGLEPENNGHGGTDQQDGRTGFDWGEGSGLASMALLLDKYGDGYVNDDPSNHWEVGIDGLLMSPLGDTSSMLPTDTADRAVEIRFKSGKKSAEKAKPHPRVASTSFGFIDGYFKVISVLTGDGAESFSGEYVRDDGKRLPALRYALASLPAMERMGRQAILPDDWSGHTFRLEGKAKGWTIDSGPYVGWINPVWNSFDSAMTGWAVDGNFAEVPTRSTRFDFGVGGRPFIGTCEDGMGGYEDKYTGTITSPSFVVTRPKIHLMVGGGSLDGVYVELLDAAGKRIAVERGHDRERMDARVWDVSGYKGQALQIRVVDKETGGWGHINVGDIRVGE